MVDGPRAGSAGLKLWKGLFALWVACALACGIGWAVLLTTFCSSHPHKPVLETAQVVPYNCHGMLVFVNPMEDRLRTWLLPAMLLFIIFAVGSGARLLFAMAKVRIDWKVHVRRE